MKLNIQFFGGRGVKSSKKTRSQKNNTNYKIDTIEGELENFKSKYIRNANNQVVGYVNYETTSEETIVHRIKVFEEYQRQGYATKMLQDLQKEIGDKNINFDLVTDDGKALLDKIANITEKKKGKYGGTYYKGRIKL